MNVVKSHLGLFALQVIVALAPLPLAAKETSSPMDLARQLNQAFIEVADKVSPSVVVIRVAHKPDYSASNDDDNPFFDILPREFRRRFEERRQRAPRRSREPIFDSEGSGIVIREDGHILTNRHVVEDADKIRVRFKDGKEYSAEVRGEDAQSDLAVIKIEAKGLTSAKLADSSKTRVGEFAIAIGAPFSLDYSVTFGHVSAKGRHIIPGDEGAAMDQDFIQTDANINPGNSGGPLVNIDGEVIGVNALIRGVRTGIGFAIPSNLAREISDKLIADGKITRAWLGVGIRSLSDYTEFRETVKGVDAGVVVYTIQPEGPAAKSDLKPSDIITAVDGRPVATPQDLKNEIRGKKIGSMVTLDVARPDGVTRVKNLKIKVKAEEWPDENIPVVNRRRETSEGATSDLGVTVKTLTRELAKQYGVEMASAVIVTEVEADSAAARRGIKAGDVITEINHQGVTSPNQFRDALKNADAKKGVVINLTSGGTSRFEVLKDSGD
jgi:serine protease Do